MSGTAENVHLHQKNGNSDKEYLISLEEKDGGWVVNYANGRRGSTLRPGTKSNKGPTDYRTAKKVYDSLLKEKLGGGYNVVGGEAPVYIAGASDKKHSGVSPQLLNAIDEETALSLNSDPSWLAQEKHDGVRMLVGKSGDEVRAINRKGIYSGFPQAIQTAARSVTGDFLIDGEAVGEQLRVFDLLEHDGTDIRPLPAGERLRRLSALLAGLNSNAIVVVETAFSAADKVSLHDRLMEQGREGIVYKKVGSPYSPGRPNSGGDQVKRKFYETLSAVAGPANSQRSVPISLFSQDGEAVAIGNCTIPSNYPVPGEGEVVEIRYLYAYRDGALAQPSYLGPRTDINAEECTMSQLKYKSGESPEPDASSGPRM